MSSSYQEAVSCEESSKYKVVIKEEMDSLRKNKTWELINHPSMQKLRSGIDYNEVFSPVVRHTSIRVILALTTCKDYELEQLDVKTIFLHGNLEEVIYIRSYAPSEYIYLLLYVDDMLITCKSKVEIGSTNSLLKKKFDMKELEEAKKIIGMEIVKDQSRKILRVSQSGYISKILNNFRRDNEKSVQMPLGGHFKLSLKDCPIKECDVERMTKMSYANARHSGTTNVGLVYGTNRGNHVDVTSFVDSDYAKDLDKGRSITGYTFLVQGCVVTWKATLQHVVALSTIEIEYMALTEAVKEAIWLRKLLEELGVELNTVVVNYDHQGAIHLSRNHVFHERTKHINVHNYFIREVLEENTVKVLKVGTEHNASDALTKVVHGRKLQYCLELLSVGVGQQDFQVYDSATDANIAQ
ncbi:retrotransposon protein, putative, ty1-copia subclass, partial [Tanacetum coccineum]